MMSTIKHAFKKLTSAPKSNGHVKNVEKKAGHAINGVFGKSVDERFLNDQGEPMSKVSLHFCPAAL